MLNCVRTRLHVDGRWRLRVFVGRIRTMSDDDVMCVCVCVCCHGNDTSRRSPRRAVGGLVQSTVGGLSRARYSCLYSPCAPSSLYSPLGRSVFMTVAIILRHIGGRTNVASLCTVVITVHLPLVADDGAVTQAGATR